MSQPPEAIFVVLSDLHFSEAPYEPADLPPLDILRLFRATGLDSRIKRYIERRCSAQNVAIMKSLPRYLRRLLEDERALGYKGHSFDLYLLFGDQATLPNERSYEFLREYLTKTHFATGDRDLSVHCAGLGILPEKLVAVPGNHDKMLRISLDLYHNQFLRPLELPREPQRQRSYMLSRRVGDREFLFLLIDASIYAGQDLFVDASCLSHLAGGEVTDPLRDEVHIKLDALSHGESVDTVPLRDYSKATKIMVVHYAVDLARVAPFGIRTFLLPHACKGLDALVKSLKSDLNLVVHGHLHTPKIYNHAGVPVIAATTATQRGNDNNGVFLLKLFASGEIRAEHHRWFGAGFSPDPDPLLSQSVNLPRSRPATVP